MVYDKLLERTKTLQLLLKATSSEATGTNVVSLGRKTRPLKPEILPQALAKQVRVRGEAVLGTLHKHQLNGNKKAGIIEALKYVGKKYDLIVAHKSELQLSVPQAVALRNHMKGVTNTLYRLKQGVETCLPLLKKCCFIIPSIQREVTDLERKGVIPLVVHNVNFVITEAGNTPGMCKLYYCR